MDDLDLIWRIFETFMVVVTGLTMGSFVTALVYRLPRHLPFSHDTNGRPVRSMCPPCGRVLGVLELIPVGSWLMQGGKCKCGKVRIPLRYPLIEMFVLGLVLILWQLQGFDLIETPRYMILPFLVAMSYLIWHGRGWAPQINLIMIALAGCIAFINLFFTHKGMVGLLPALLVLPLFLHGSRLPSEYQQYLLMLTVPLLLVSVLLI